jgi:heme-degrading monooxygenase HmoA
MFARHVITTVKRDKLEEALKIYEESVIPETKGQKGYRGIYLLTNQDTGKIVSISLWDSREDALANESGGYFRRQVDKFDGIMVTTPVKEEFDIRLMLSKPK